MKTVKKVTAMLISLTMIVLLSFSAVAAENQTESYVVKTEGIIIQARYVNINTTALSRGNTWVYADMETKSDMSLRIDIKIYKNGSLDFSDYTTAYDSYCLLDVDYDFIKGVSYKIEATYKAGTETVPKSMSFTA